MSLFLIKFIKRFEYGDLVDEIRQHDRLYVMNEGCIGLVIRCKNK